MYDKITLGEATLFFDPSGHDCVVARGQEMLVIGDPEYAMVEAGLASTKSNRVNLYRIERGEGALVDFFA